MSHQFRLIKGREEFDLDPELFNHVDGRQVADLRGGVGGRCVDVY